MLFSKKQVQFLRRFVIENSKEMWETDIETVRYWPLPLSSKDVERFLVLANYHRAFIRDFARIAVPLYRITGKKEFVWEESTIGLKLLEDSFVEPATDGFT